MTQESLADEFGVVSPRDIDKDLIVLLVEDQTDVRLIVAHHLNKLGFKKVHQSANGYDASQFVQSCTEKISLTICDMEMPILGGIELLQEMRDNPKIARTPFALAMDNPSRDKIMLASENTVDEVMVKPYTLKDIFPKIQKAFSVFHNSANPEKVYELAKEALRMKDLAKAKKIYRRLSATAQRSARPFVGLAAVSRLEGKIDEALKFLKEAEGQNQYFVPIYSMRGELLIETKDIPGAIAEFKRAIEMSPLNPLRYEAAANLLFSQKRYEEAVALLTVAVEKDLQFPQLHHFLSQGYFALKDFKKAVRHIRSALSHDPANVVYLNQLGISYKESDQFDEAVKVYNSVIKIDPDNKAALYNKAVLLRAKGHFDEAIKILERLVQKNPDFAIARDKLQECVAEKAKVQTPEAS